MIKSFLILLSFSTLLFSSQQILLVVADDFNATNGHLYCFEDTHLICNDIKVNLGKNGLGWGLGEYKFQHSKKEPFKYEGDKKAPAGIFKLTKVFGYAQKQNIKMPYLYTSQNLICVDDAHSPYYNQIIKAHGDEKSFEYMHRKDKQYKLGIVVAHNQNAEAKKGSCIFLHVQKGKNKPTVGCTSMKYKDIKHIIDWLDIKKNPLLIQIPKQYLQEAIKLYPQLQMIQGQKE